MSFNTKWNVDLYKTEHESDEHWELRRKFMMMHKKKFPEERLVCLAQVFSNVEFLGCRYPTETMHLVAELSKGVVESYREKQKSKLQRTFVKASDAAGAKVKGLRRPGGDAGTSSDVPPKIPKCSDDSQVLTANLEREKNEENSEPKICCINERQKSNDTPDPMETLNSKLCSEVENLKEVYINDTIDLKSVTEEVTAIPSIKSNASIEEAKVEECVKFEPVSAGVFGRLVLIEEENVSYANVLMRSTSLCGIPYQCVCEEGKAGEVSCRIFVNDHLVVSVSDACKTTAQDTATFMAVKKLQDICYTLKVKKQRILGEEVVKMSHILSSGKNDGLNSVPKAELMTPIPEDNLGRKLMKSMGWAGGGLGKTEQGIKEPVSVCQRQNRAGIGAERLLDGSFKDKMRLYFLQYLQTGFAPNLVFTSDEFSFAERDIILSMAKNMWLQTKLTARGDAFRLVITRKNSLARVAVDMMSRGVTSDEYYEIIEPKSPDSKMVKSGVTAVLAFYPLLENEFRSSVDNNSDTYSINENLDNNERGNVSKAAKRRLKRESKSARKKARKQEKAIALENLKNYSMDEVNVGPYGNFFLVEYENSEDSPMQILRESSSCNHIPIKYRSGKLKSVPFCKAFVNSHLLTTTNGSNRKTARANCYRIAYEKLKQICYTLKVKRGVKNGPEIQRDFVLNYPHEADIKPSVSGTSNNLGNSMDRPLNENIGSRLMRSMGWSGGGLGKNQQGIEEPLGFSTQIKRSGLGHTPEEKNPAGASRKRGGVDQTFQEKFRELLKNYVNSDASYEMYFTTLFSKSERAMMHMEASHFGLKSKSYGKDDDRYLVISKTKDFCKIVDNMLQTGQMVSSQYELIKPCISLSPANEPKVSLKDNLQKSPDVTCAQNDQFTSVAPSLSLKTKNTKDFIIVNREPNPEIPDMSVANQETTDLSTVKKEPKQETHVYSEVERESKLEMPNMLVQRAPNEEPNDMSTSNNKSSPFHQFDQQEDLGKSNNLSLLVENIEEIKMSPEIFQSLRHNILSEQFGSLILIEDEKCITPAQIIEKSANDSHIPFKYECYQNESKMVFQLSVNGVTVTSGTGNTKKQAKDRALENGLEKLREVCYTLRTQVVKIGENNIKFMKTLMLPYKKRKLMKGKGTHIFCKSEVIGNFVEIERRKEFTKKSMFHIKKDIIKNHLKEYIAQVWPYDLIISPELPGEDRRLYETIASSFQLKTTYQKISQKHFLIISKKLSPIDTAVAMLLGECQRSESKV